MNYAEGLQGVPQELAFDVREYAARIEKVRRSMARQGIDVLVVTHVPNICYLTGYQSPATDSYTALFITATVTVLQLVEHEVPNAVLTSTVRDLHPYAWYKPETIAGMSIAIAADLSDRARPTIGLERERPGLPAAYVDAFEAKLPNASFVDASVLVYELRRIKSPAEVAYLKEAGRLSVLGAEAAIGAIRVGATDNSLGAAGYAAMVDAGSEYAATQPFIATGVRSSMVHTTFKRRPLANGDLAFVEFAASFQRYSAPVMRTAIVGDAPDYAERLVSAVTQTLTLLLTNIKPYRTADEVAAAVERPFAELGDDVFFQGAYGYHIGLSLPPNWWEGLSPYIARGIEEPLLPGMTFHLPVAARIPGKGGVGLSESVVVTADGCESLTASRREVTRIAFVNSSS